MKLRHTPPLSHRRRRTFFVAHSLLIILILLTAPLCGFAQFTTNYQALPIEDTIPPTYLSALNTRLSGAQAAISESNKAVIASIRKYLQNRTDYVISRFNDDYIISDPTLTSSLQRLLKDIYDANPQFKPETHVFVYRSEAVNAVSFGEGTIALTLGLLARMETEGQIAFVLCHELAHYHYKHSDNKIVALSKLYNDKEFKKEVRSIKRSDYEQITKFSKLAKSLELSITHHGREHEFEADSLALRMYRNLTSDVHSPIRTLEILDSADRDEFPNNLDLKTALHTDAYPFKDQWLAYTPSSTWHATSEDNDSTRTHPSCQRRIKALQRQMKSLPACINNKFNADARNTLREHCRFEQVASLVHYKRYGRALFESLKLAARYPDNAYVHAIIGQCLYQHYAHQQNHELGKVLSLPDPRFAENYDRFLTFMHNLRLSELASLSYHYMASRKDRYISNEEFLFGWWMASQTGVGNVASDEIKKAYIKTFPHGKYIKKFNK
ncbi:M48 family metalloprotease [Pseudochryseolinea flava]|uniref:Peptidase M48 domain-containing protein n=1 Tax=Pseudochryseolinea flava TaxID=2059302 RepID=A0A364Y2C6_9BACT|nr:M48 family metalloprotease [Pseudochryseolinea flava]RAW00433.1 hypothetical protein DQQ10_15405 [Pseudochryseolinea flava]